MNDDTPPDADTTLETDDRFPSGPWVGFFLQRELPGKHEMGLALRFADGVMTGEGRDWVGEFLVRGTYDVSDGRCRWHKRYLGRHDVFYKGFNEGRGIWGTWAFTGPAAAGVSGTGGFHIWPEGMPDPTGGTLHEEEDLPAVVFEEVDDAVPAETVSPGSFIRPRDPVRSSPDSIIEPPA